MEGGHKGHSGILILLVVLANHEQFLVCHVQNAAQVEGAVYVGITLAMDIAEVPAITATAERSAWENTFIDELQLYSFHTQFHPSTQIVGDLLPSPDLLNKLHRTQPLHNFMKSTPRYGLQA